MEFANLEQLKEQFIKGGQLPFPEDMTLAGIEYHAKDSSSYSLEEMIMNNWKAMWIYSTPQVQEARDAGLNQLIIFLWGFMPEKYVMLPYDVRTSSQARLVGRITEKTDTGNGSINISKDKIVGDVVDVIITSIPNSNPMKGKVDTGADVSSIHAENWQVNNGEVSFECPELSENRITMPVIEKQAIKSSNGDTEYRPVIELNISVNNQQLSNVMFNLNDRGTMTYPMLVGQNILECGGFMIDPTINDPDKVEEDFEIDFEALQEEFKDDLVYMDVSVNIQDIITHIK